MICHISIGNNTVLEVYRDNVTFPYTDTLDGIQDLGGLPTNTQVKN